MTHSVLTKTQETIHFTDRKWHREKLSILPKIIETWVSGPGFVPVWLQRVDQTVYQTAARWGVLLLGSEGSLFKLYAVVSWVYHSHFHYSDFSKHSVYFCFRAIRYAFVVLYRYVWHRLYLLKDIFLTRVYISWHMNSLRDFSLSINNLLQSVKTLRFACYYLFINDELINRLFC